MSQVEDDTSMIAWVELRAREETMPIQTEEEGNNNSRSGMLCGEGVSL